MEKQIKKSQSFVIKNSTPLRKILQKDHNHNGSLLQDNLKKVSFSVNPRETTSNFNQKSSQMIKEQQQPNLPKLRQKQILAAKKPFSFSELSQSCKTSKKDSQDTHFQFSITVQELLNSKNSQQNKRQQMNPLEYKNISQTNHNSKPIDNQENVNEQKESLKYLKEIFPQLAQQIMDLFSDKLETTEVYKDKKKILLIEKLINYGATKQNTLFHLRKYLNISLEMFQFGDQYLNNQQKNEMSRRFCSSQQNQQIFDRKETNILYQIPRQVSELFLNCIQQIINKNQNLNQKNFLINIFAKNIHLLQPSTPLQEICSTEYFIKIIELIYDELSSEPYLYNIIPKKTPQTLRLANQLSSLLLVKNYQLIPQIIKKFKNSSVFIDPKHNILLRAELLEQLDKEIQEIKEMVSLQLEDQDAQYHYFEKISSTDFYLIKLLIRKSLEKKAKLSSDEINMFIEIVEEARYLAMPHLYKIESQEQNIVNLVKLMTSKIISLSSDFLNKYFEQQNLSLIIQLFSKQIVNCLIIQPDLEKLKIIFDIKEGEKISKIALQKLDSLHKMGKESFVQKRFTSNQQQLISSINSQFLFLNEIEEIFLISLKQLDYKLVFQRNIQYRFNKIGQSLIPQNFNTSLIDQIQIFQIPFCQINLSNINAVQKKIQVCLTKKYIYDPDVKIQPLCEIAREFLLCFCNERNTYSTEDLIGSFKYQDIPFSQSKYLIEAFEFALSSLDLWSESIKLHILEEFSFI